MEWCAARSVIISRGKPTPEKVKGALLGHIAEGSSAVHDMEKAHLSLVRADRCSDEAYKADVRDPEYLECMGPWPTTCAPGPSAASGASRA